MPTVAFNFGIGVGFGLLTGFVLGACFWPPIAMRLSRWIDGDDPEPRQRDRGSYS
jgi:hypothetical protein